MEIRAQFPRASHENEILTITDVMFTLTRVREAAARQEASTNQGGKRGSSGESKVTMNLLDLLQC